MPTDPWTPLVLAGLGVLGVAMALCVARAVRGPSLFDRVLAFDCLALNAVGVVLLLSILLDTAAFIDVVLVVALLGFLGTMSLAAYLEGSLVD
ncbi:MAG: monovalent cation/H+ antiporter complex subunit F [Gemmatimonadota bacterium]